MNQDQLTKAVDRLFMACGLVISAIFIFGLGFLFLFLMLGV